MARAQDGQLSHKLCSRSIWPSLIGKQGLGCALFYLDQKRARQASSWAARVACALPEVACLRQAAGSEISESTC